jgi:hypothetical protein
MQSPTDWTISTVLSPAVQELRTAVDYPLCGALVFWAPLESGKTFALRDLTKLLQNEDRIATYINGKSLTGKAFNHFSTALRFSLNMSPTVEIDDLIALGTRGRPSTLIIDHFDDVMLFPDTEAVMLGLARESRERRTFNIVLGMSSFQKADEVIEWNGGHKLRMACREGCGRWMANATRMYALNLPVVKSLPADEQEEVIRLAIKAGSAGKVEEIALSSPNARVEIAKQVQAAWDEGIHALKKWYVRI